MCTHTLKIGDILVTNCDRVVFYEVVKIKPKSEFVLLRRIESQITTRGFIPEPGHYISKPLRVYVRKRNYITIDFLLDAKPWQGRAQYPISR